MVTTYYKGAQYNHSDYDTTEKQKKLPKAVKEIILKTKQKI